MLSNEPSMLNKLSVALICLCVALCIAMGLQHRELVEAQAQNMRMEKQIKTLTAQVNEITAQWMEMVKRMKYHSTVK